MRNTLIATLFALPVAVLAGSPQIVVLDVQKMTCSLCSVTVQKALEKVPGVANTTIDYDKKTATPAALMKATSEAGFPSSPHHASKP